MIVMDPHFTVSLCRNNALLLVMNRTASNLFLVAYYCYEDLQRDCQYILLTPTIVVYLNRLQLTHMWFYFERGLLYYQIL